MPRRAPARTPPSTIDEYIAGCAPEVRPILRKIRRTIRDAVPDADETISYGMPAYRLDRIVAYFAAFKHHIGFYPPVKGSSSIEKAASRYAGEKGNLRFPLDRPMPYRLIERIVRSRAAQQRSKRRRP